MKVAKRVALKEKNNCEWGWVLTRLLVVIISQYVQILNPYVVHLKLLCFMSVVSQ